MAKRRKEGIHEFEQAVVVPRVSLVELEKPTTSVRSSAANSRGGRENHDEIIRPRPMTKRRKEGIHKFEQAVVVPRVSLEELKKPSVRLSAANSRGGRQNHDEIIRPRPKKRKKEGIKELEKKWRKCYCEGDWAPSMECNDYSTIGEMKPDLQKGYTFFNGGGKFSTLGGYIAYGCFVDEARRLFSRRQEVRRRFFGRGANSVTDEKHFSIWLKDNIGKSVSWISKIRNVSRILKDYKKFYKLRVPFSQIYSNKNELEELLKYDAGVAAFWKY
jgi:hypothetical protein